MRLRIFLGLLLCLTFKAHSQDLKTKYVIVVVVDGPRYSETWGDSNKKYIPYLNKLSKSGVVADSFYNDRFTYTSAGHTAITTGYYQQLENTKGSQLPDQPSFMQYYLKKNNLDSSKAWVITSKDKLAMLGNTDDKEWKNKFKPSLNCGLVGQGSGYRNDTVTYENIIKVLKEYQPHVVVVNFREPDWSGHRKDWNGYLRGIKGTDSLVNNIWNFIQSNPFYKNKTALFVTNDHGRHLNGWKEGFAEHGDLCEGCKHINFYAFGPDFKRNYITHIYHNQPDLTATISYLLNLDMRNVEGEVMKEIFKNK